tara:strand:- start:588 stop:824 length:237 start_codon:yes stop_codon:yes gene_type:complete
MNRNSFPLSFIIRPVLSVVSLESAMRHKKIHGCDYMDDMQKIAEDAITILSHLGKYDEDIKGYALALLNRFEAIKYEQ